MELTGKEDFGDSAHLAEVDAVQDETRPRVAHGLINAAHLYRGKWRVFCVFLVSL